MDYTREMLTEMLTEMLRKLMGEATTDQLLLIVRLLQRMGR